MGDGQGIGQREGHGADPRRRLLEAALELLEANGAEAVKARSVTAMVGASTMALYTHFGSLTALFEAMIREAFTRLDRRQHEVARTDDPVADLMAIGLAYRAFAVENPNTYRLMFGLTAPGGRAGMAGDVTSGSPTTLVEANATFAQLIEVVTRVIAGDRIDPADPATVAGQVWSMTHGFVLLDLAGVFGDDDRGVFEILAPMTVNLLVGLGDERAASFRSALTAAKQLDLR